MPSITIAKESTSQEILTEVRRLLPSQQEKTVDILENGITTVTPDEGINYMTKVTVNAKVKEFHERDINFFDYDGTLIEAWDLEDLPAKTALPPNPSHSKLVADGWNWTLEELKAHNIPVNVGQMYHTASGLSEFDIILNQATGLQVNFNMPGSKNWGDGTTNTQNVHVYKSYGKYTITCNGTSITGSDNMGVFQTSTSYARDGMLLAVRIGNNIAEIGKWTFFSCMNLEYVSLPSSVTAIGEAAFRACWRLRSMTIPRQINGIANSTFNYDYELRQICIPNNVTTIGNSAFYMCFSLSHIRLPYEVTNIGSYAFYQCTKLEEIDSHGVAEIKESAFYNCYSMKRLNIAAATVIGNNALWNCYSLSDFTMGNSITRIGTQAFRSCVSLDVLDFSAYTAVPTAGDMPFYDTTFDLKILVPATLYNEWIATENWATFANRIYKQ